MTIRTFTASILCSLSLLISPLLSADEAQDKGLSIAKEMKSRDRGWVDSSAEMEMVLHSRGGRETRREMRILALEVQNDGDKSMTIFDSPNDVKGTAFLSFTHNNADDDQWLYLPALKRVKRIASKNKSGPFMGSEFSYEDLSSFEVEEYDYRWLRDEELNGALCFVVEIIPRDKYSGYTREIVWIDQEHYRAMKIEFYDRKDGVLKTLTLSDYQLHLDKFWRPAKQTMVNERNGKSTEVLLRNYQFRSGLDEQDFTENSLKRAR
ncbi:MAG: outer membrane lipoprotein-sorting protein [Zhongshania sp.]|nr:outer membrane lipoprotein-sorting protein [Zhongshania sp.]